MPVFIKAIPYDDLSNVERDAFGLFITDSDNILAF
jgi:hypothetical protein